MKCRCDKQSKDNSFGLRPAACLCLCFPATFRYWPGALDLGSTRWSLGSGVIVTINPTTYASWKKVRRVKNSEKVVVFMDWRFV